MPIGTSKSVLHMLAFLLVIMKVHVIDRKLRVMEHKFIKK